jgi:hypothetical protein
MALGDGLVYYSPNEAFRVTPQQPCQSFTAIGRIKSDLTYQVDMGEGFKPHRRDVQFYSEGVPAPIRPLLPRLSVTRDLGSRWGMVFRRGVVEITEEDFQLIADAMHITLDPASTTIPAVKCAPPA